MRRDELDAMPRFRMVGNAVLSYLTKIASGYWKMMDPQNGYTAISREALETADIENMYEYYGYCNDLLVKLNVENLRVADVSHSSEFVYDDEDWKSHISYDEYVPKVSLMLLRNFGWRLKHKYLLRDFHPLAAFYALGTVLAGVAVVGGAVSGLTGDDAPGGLVRWLLAFAFGVALFLAGTVLDLNDNEELELQVTEDTYEN
jgi:hypothetical protein